MLMCTFLKGGGDLEKYVLYTCENVYILERPSNSATVLCKTNDVILILLQQFT